MPQMTNVQLLNTAGTLVDMHMVTTQQGATPAEWTERTGIFQHDARATLLVRKSASGQTDKATLRIRLPLVNQVTGQVESTDTVNVEFTMSRKGSTANRYNLAALIQSALALPIIGEAVVFGSPMN